MELNQPTFYSIMALLIMFESIILYSWSGELENRAQKLRMSNEQLRNEIEERKKIAIDLEEAKDEAVNALEYKNQILANVSHDARTPINIIMLNTDLVQLGQNNLTDKQKARLQTIVASCKDLLGFITNLLDAASIQSDKAEPEFTKIVLIDYFTGIRSKYRELVEQNNLYLNINIESDLPSVVGSDVDWLNKIMSNLITNAIKFTSQGGITISAGTKNSNSWYISISDTGIGIPDDALDYIFQPFRQVDGSVERKVNRGVGLGLSIVEHFVKSLNGSIHVESIVGKGTTFELEFPIEKSNYVTINSAYLDH